GRGDELRGFGGYDGSFHDLTPIDSLDPQAVDTFKSGDIGKHDLIAFAQAGDDLDILERRAAELDRDALRLVAAQHEHAGAGVRLTDRGPRDVQHVLRGPELDHTVDVLIRARILRQLA